MLHPETLREGGRICRTPGHSSPVSTETAFPQNAPRCHEMLSLQTGLSRDARQMMALCPVSSTLWLSGGDLCSGRRNRRHCQLPVCGRGAGGEGRGQGSAASVPECLQASPPCCLAVPAPLQSAPATLATQAFPGGRADPVFLLTCSSEHVWEAVRRAARREKALFRNLLSPRGGEGNNGKKENRNYCPLCLLF